MKLLILSDSHGEQEFMQLAVRRERPDAVIHLGDHCADADRLAEEFCGLPVLSVRGNCDLWGPPRAETLLRTFEGVRIFGTHGHRYGVKQGLLRFSLAAQEQKAQVALFGHTHIPYCRQEGGLWLLNPGACGGRAPSCGIVTVDGGKAVCCVKDLLLEETL